MIRLAGTLLALLLALAAADRAFAQALQDVAGGRDHPLVKRYEGSVLLAVEEKAFDEQLLALGPYVTGPDGKDAFTRSRTVEGKRSRRLYMAPDGRSSLEVYRNYEKALAEAGFKPLFSCAKESCGRDGRLGYVLFGSKPLPNKTAKGAGLLVNDAFTGSSDERLLVALREDGPRQVYVQLLVAKSFGFEARGRKEAGPAVLLEILEIGQMEERMVTVDASAMAKSIAEAGSVSLYGIYFDTDKAVVKPESAETLDEIAKLLKAEPGLELYVVGHTDDQGGLDYNLGLSRRRAQAVVDELVKKRGIKAARLTPAGVAMLAPKAPNATEEGRAQNRRVELVRR